MTSDSGFDAGGFPGLLGDMLKMMRTDAPLQWELALQFAQTVASDGKAEPNVDPVQRIRYEELARIAELQVADVIGMPTTPSGTPLMFATTGPAGWARRSLESWRPIVERFASAIRPATPDVEDHEDEEESKDLARLMEQWSKAISPAMIALQIGSAIGHLARTTLGQYELPLPRRAGDEIAVVPENTVRFATEWSLDPDDTVLWVAARDLTMHAILSRSHVRDRFSTLLVEHAENLRPDLTALVDRLGELSPTALEDPNELNDLLGDTGFGADVDAPQARRLREELATLERGARRLRTVGDRRRRLPGHRRAPAGRRSDAASARRNDRGRARRGALVRTRPQRGDRRSRRGVRLRRLRTRRRERAREALDC